MKGSDRLNERFRLNHQRVPIASTKSSVRIAEGFQPNRRKVPSESSKSSDLGYRKVPDYQKVPAGLSRGSGSKVPDYQKFRPDYQETPVPEISGQKLPARLCGDLRHYKTQNQSTLLSKQKQHYALSGASVRQKIPGAIVSMYFISTC